MDLDHPHLPGFLSAQLRDHGGQAELDADLWTLLAVPAADTEANALAQSLLRTATFAHDSGQTEDDQWTLYYLDTANRPLALAWLDNTVKIIAGEIRPVAPAHQALVTERITSAQPHRLAQNLATRHIRGELSAGLFHQPAEVRALLDSHHPCEPLFVASFLTLLSHHLIAMLVLHREILAEDIALKNELVLGALSSDPLLQSRQDAAAEIRNILLRFQIIHPIDQQKKTAVKNPYTVFLEVVYFNDEVTAPIDGIAIAIPRADFLSALHAIRRNLARGDSFHRCDAQAPWMDRTLASPFRFITQRVDRHPELTALDTLGLLARAARRRTAHPAPATAAPFFFAFGPRLRHISAPTRL
jgi:hypothetical protein